MSCAGMTAFLVLFAQTWEGFLWRAREKFPSTPSTRTSFQKRRGLCKGHSCSHPSATDLLHHGPIGHARTGWSRDYHRLLKYGASFSGLDDQDDPVFLIRLQDEDLLESPDDSAFLMTRPFQQACGSPAQELMEFIRLRLHLVVVDLHRRRRIADRVGRLLVDLQVDRCAEECLHTLPIRWKQNQEAYQLRCAFGDAMEESDLPCYILWPARTAEQSFWCER